MEIEPMSSALIFYANQNPDFKPLIFSWIDLFTMKSMLPRKYLTLLDLHASMKLCCYVKHGFLHILIT